MSDVDDRKQEDEAGETLAEPRACMPCHGSGKVISNLGGEPSEVTCPWCQGSGERLTGADAQEFHSQQVAQSGE